MYSFKIDLFSSQIADNIGFEEIRCCNRSAGDTLRLCDSSAKIKSLLRHPWHAGTHPHKSTNMLCVCICKHAVIVVYCYNRVWHTQAHRPVKPLSAHVTKRQHLMGSARTAFTKTHNIQTQNIHILYVIRDRDRNSFVRNRGNSPLAYAYPQCFRARNRVIAIGVESS